MVKIPLMMAKPVLKKFRQIIKDKNKNVDKLKSSKDMKEVNKAQKRLDSSKEYRIGVIETMKNKLPPSAVKMLKKGFDEVVKKRKDFRDAVGQAAARKISGRKPNFKGGLIKKPKLAKRGY